jgi:hypothetical protein
VDQKLGIGLGDTEPRFNLELGPEKVMSVGNQMFFSGEDGPKPAGYISANLFRKAGEWALLDAEAGGAVVAMKTGGEIEISGTLKAGSTKLASMMTINAASQTVAFPMRGLKAGFGTTAPGFPIHVVGAAKVGNTQASIAFGASEESMGYLGATDKHVFVGTHSGQEALSVEHATGNVGVGTSSPQSALHLVSDKEASISFGSAKAQNTRAFIAAQPTEDGVNMVMGVKNAKGADKLSFDFANTVSFAGSGATVFSRGDTVFKTGNVGIGGDTFDKEYKLHVKGDAKIEGRVFVSKKRKKLPTSVTSEATAPKTPIAAPDLMEHLDLTDLLEEEEGSTQEHDAIDVLETMSKLSRVLRKQMKQMKAHDQKIAILSSQMEMLSQATF